MPKSKQQIARVFVPAHIYLDIPITEGMSDEEIFAAAAAAVKTASDLNGGSLKIDDIGFDEEADPVLYPVTDLNTGNVATAGMGVEDRRTED